MIPIEINGVALSQNRPAICAPLVGRDVDALQRELRSVVPKHPDLLEWRLDFFANIHLVDEVVRAAEVIGEQAPQVPLLLTCRSAREGGQVINIGERRVADSCCRLCESGAIQLIDLEIDGDADLRAAVMQVARRNQVAIVLSHHNFTQTLGMDALVEKFLSMQVAGADIAKVAMMPQRPVDVLALLNAVNRAAGQLTIPVVGMSMGELGVMSRIYGGLFGSSMTFAVGSDSSAPGQISIESLRMVWDTASPLE